MSEMPQCPAQITQCGGANVLTVLVSVTSMMRRIIQCTCLLEMMQAGGKLPYRHVGGAEDAMRDASHCRVVGTLRRSKELQGYDPLLVDFARDVVAGPHPIQDGKFL